MLFHCSITDFRWFFRSSCTKKCKQRCVYIICALMFWRDTVKYSFRFSPHVHYLVQSQVTHDVWWALPHESQQIHNLFSDILYFLRACWRNLALPVVTSTVFFFSVSLKVLHSWLFILLIPHLQLWNQLLKHLGLKEISYHLI